MRARPGGAEWTDRTEGHRTGRGRATPFGRFWCFERSFLRNSLGLPPGQLARALPRPSCRASRRELEFPRGPAPPGRQLHQPPRTGPSRLLRKGKAHAGARPGGERVCAEGQRVLRGAKLPPASFVSPAWLRGRERVSLGSGSCDGQPTSLVVARLLGTRGLQKEACPLPSKWEVGTFEPFTLK